MCCLLLEGDGFLMSSVVCKEPVIVLVCSSFRFGDALCDVLLFSARTLCYVSCVYVLV